MFVFSNLAISLDGKIATRSRVLFPLGTPEDRRQMQVLRAQCDAILVGAATLRSYCQPSRAKNHHPMNVILSSTLKGISPNWPFFREKRTPRILLTGSGLPEKRIREFSASSEVIPLKPSTAKNPTARQIIHLLEERGVKRLLVEGGGEVMWLFASLNLIDEYHVTLTPRILGGRDAPTLVDGQGFDPKDVLNLKLKNSRTIGNEIYLVYSKTNRRGG